MARYDPFVRGPHPAGVRSFEALDPARSRSFPCEIWYPAAARHAGEDLAPGSQDLFTVPPRDAPRRQAAVRDAAARPATWPLVVYSHPSGQGRRAATFLCTHLASHGYMVAALDHSEMVAKELARRSDETDEQKQARWAALMASRVADVRFLLDRLIAGPSWDSGAALDPARIGIVGHSLGGWTALASVDVESRLKAVVALAPGGASRRKPGMLPATLAFAWDRDVPTLLLAAEGDTSLPLAGMHELFERTPASKRMAVLRRADHLHFLDDVEELHESVRNLPLSGELAWLQREMRPIGELCSGEQAHVFVRGLSLAHLDATLRQREEARRFMAGDLRGELAERGVETIVT